VNPESSPDVFASARKVADAVLYEGYALYPYRASAAKNRIRFQWGVLVPPFFAALDPSEHSVLQTELLAERAESARLDLLIRFLHLSERRLEVQSDGGWSRVDELDRGDEVLQTWDDSAEQEVAWGLSMEDVIAGPVLRDISWEADQSTEEVVTKSGTPARVVRHRRAVSCRVEVGGRLMLGPHGVIKITVRVSNLTTDDSTTRDAALRRSLVGCHLLAAVSDRGRFISSMAPPEWARSYLEDCDNIGSFPVLVGAEGDDQVVLASPIILYDHPAIAPESAGDLFDALEIDEILTLRTMTLTEDEKRQARGTDPRIAAIIDQVDFLPPEMLDRLHGAIRQVHPASDVRQVTDDAPAFEDAPSAPWWDPGADRSVSPTTDTVTVDGRVVSRGSRVRLRPALQRSDAQDMFLTGRVAVVEAVLMDVDDNVHLAVVLEDDPAADLMAVEGRYLYFAPDEVAPLEAVS
jgi:hypothetical protein